MQRFWSQINRFLLNLICGQKIEIIGLDNLPQYPFVIASKHQSYWEAFLFPALFPPFVWVLKVSLTRIPVIGPAFNALGAIGLERTRAVSSLKQLLEKTSKAFDEGLNVVIFPEGTRIPPGKIGNYKAGAAQVAVQANVPIVPVAHNAGELWPMESFLINPGTVTLKIGPPIRITKRDHGDVRPLVSDIKNAIESLMVEITSDKFRR